MTDQRAIFVQKPYRYIDVTDAGVRARFNNANELVFESNLSDSTAALRLANAIYAVSSGFALGFRVTVEGLYFSESFIGAPERFTIVATGWSDGSRIFTLANVETNYLYGTSILTVRG